MPQYWSIREMIEANRVHAIDRLLALRQQLSAQVPKKREDTLLLATWNIRDLGGARLNPSPRLPESFHYIAEIINAYDLVAVQEVNRNLRDFETVMRLLGRNYDYLVADTTEGRGGNEERIAFVYDKRKVHFRNIVGEVVLPPDAALKALPKQFSRTPYVASFQAGWFKFHLCSVHIYYGSDTGPKLKARIAEIESLARFFAARQKKEPGDYFLLGDFNIVSTDHPTMKALTDHGFVMPGGVTTRNIALAGSNIKRDKWYDQIVLRPADKRLEVGKSGVFNFRESIFSDADSNHYKTEIPDSVSYDKWLTWQMSDHLPLWVELKVDFTNEYLNSLKPGKRLLAKKPR